MVLLKMTALKNFETPEMKTFCGETFLNFLEYLPTIF